MDEYIKKYDQLDKVIVYHFTKDHGGIGDCIKFFIYTLQLCIKNNYKLYYEINNLPLEKYLKLKHSKMYIKTEDIKNRNKINDVKDIENINSNNHNIVVTYIYYKIPNLYDEINLNCNDVFYFTDEVKINSDNILSSNITSNIRPYISLHLRLGDKYLETDKNFVICKSDERLFSEEKIFNFIEENHNKNIIFFCDNNNYKKKLKEKYKNIIIANSIIGHTGLRNTTLKQTLDAISEFYLITRSEKIYCGAESGFSIIASKFNNIPLIKL